MSVCVRAYRRKSEKCGKMHVGNGNQQCWAKKSSRLFRLSGRKNPRKQGYAGKTVMNRKQKLPFGTGPNSPIDTLFTLDTSFPTKRTRFTLLYSSCLNPKKTPTVFLSVFFSLQKLLFGGVCEAGKGDNRVVAGTQR